VSTNRHSPIGVFDSGVGGLTVLKALLERLPGERTVYLGDTARVPYGTKSPDVVTRYSLKNAELLMEHGIKLLVVACNTASSVALPALSKALPVPVIGVIGPGAAAAAKATRSGRVGVIGTEGTIASGAYQRALVEARADVVTVTQACPLFVPLAEEGWTEGDVPKLVAQRYLSPLLAHNIDTLVLGCTHYPLLTEVIARAAGPEVVLVDSAHATAERVELLLREKDLLNSSLESRASSLFLVTDVPGRFEAVGSRFLGQPLSAARQVDLRFG
jgi:glutamate racemase